MEKHQKDVATSRLFRYSLPMPVLTQYTDEEIAKYNKSFGRYEYDAEKDEYFSTWGQYAAPELVGTRRVISKESIVASMRRLERDMQIYSCD